MNPNGLTSKVDCSFCGDCCREMVYPHTKAVLRANRQSVESADFILKHWYRISKDEFVKRIIKPGYRRAARRNMRGKPLYNCRMLDPSTRLCMAHESRPPVCRGYPWYGGEPRKERLGAQFRCSFWFAIPVAEWSEGVRPIGFIPLEEVGGV